MSEAAKWTANNLKFRNIAMVREWMPIETAPKDGTEILVAHKDAVGFMQIVGWDDQPAKANYPWAAPDEPHYHREAFTHWMPLPEPPQS